MVELRRVRSSDPLVGPLMADLEAAYDRLYGEIYEWEPIPAEEFDPPAGTFLALVDGDVLLAGGGLRRRTADTGEVKRMWTAPDHRRKGYASLVLTALETAARAAGYTTLVLQTGPLQPEALALYTRRGYHQIPRYGPYPDAQAFHLDLLQPPDR